MSDDVVHDLCELEQKKKESAGVLYTMGLGFFGMMIPFGGTIACVLEFLVRSVKRALGKEWD